MNRFVVKDLPLSGMKRIEHRRVGDHRGFLSRLFCAGELAAAGWQKPIAQINHTYTAQRGTIRGLHFQYLPYAEMKMVTCLRGKVWDVAVDLRADSATFLDWHAEILSADNLQAVLLPEGFAHGFQAMSNDAELLYFHSAPYNQTAEAGLNPEDPLLAIDWPLAVAEVSARDTSHPLLTAAFTGITIR